MILSWKLDEYAIINPRRACAGELQYLLTLGAHVRGLLQSSCVCVCVCVCLSVPLYQRTEH